MQGGIGKMYQSEDLIWKVWSKGEMFAGNDPVFWRRDPCGAWIFRGHYNRKDSEYGWTIDHIKQGTGDNYNSIENLRPVHWENTTHRPDDTLECNVTSTGVHNEKPVRNERIQNLDLHQIT